MNDIRKDPELRQELSLLDSTMINVGTMIGSGIFLVPATIAMTLHSSPLIILVWVVGGIVSLCGALSIAELGAMMPHAGGLYIYLTKAYGPLPGFLYGWATFIVINTASIAAIAVTSATYLGYFIPLSPVAIKVAAIGSIVILTLINCLGLKLGALVQDGLTLLKIGLLAALGLLCFILSGGSESLSPVLPSIPLGGLAGPFGVAMVAALWSYDGWIEITYVAGEIKNPQRVLPRSLMISTAIVIGVYVLMNAGYLHVLSVGEMSGSTLVASDSAVRIMGSTGAAFVALAVIISTIGANNGIIFTSPRIYYAMAKEGLFFTWLAHIHPGYRTPVPSLIVQGVVASALILSGTFDQLITYVVFASWLFYALSCAAVFTLRRRSPGASRPYKVWGYPFTPVVFILFALYLVINTVIEDPVDSAIGAGIIAAGIPAYLYWRKKSGGTSAIRTTYN